MICCPVVHLFGTAGFGAESTKYTKDGPGTKGGSSWTPEWLTFDNSYFVEVKEKRDAELLVLPTDDCLFTDPGFKCVVLSSSLMKVLPLR